MPQLLNGTYGDEIIDALFSTMKKAGAATTKKKRGISLLDAGFLCIEEAYNKVSNNGQYWGNARQLIYAACPEMLKLSGLDSFTDSCFSQQVLPLFLQRNPDLTARWKVSYDKRGSVIQPHTGQSVGLGTIDVDRMQKQKSLMPMAVFHPLNIQMLHLNEGLGQSCS